MDRRANEDPTHIATEEEIDVYRGNWWIHSNFVGSDTMPVRHRPDFKKALSTLHRLKKAEDKAYYQNWSQSSSSSWWHWQTSWWHPSFETSPRRWTWHWSNKETWEVSETSIYVWQFMCNKSLTKNLVQNYSDHFGNSEHSSPSPTGGVKSTSPTTENWLRKWIRKLYLQHEQHQHERWGQQAWHKLHQPEWHEQSRRAQAARVSTAHRARCFRRDTLTAHAPHLAQVVLESSPHLHNHTCVVLLDLIFLPFYFDLTFPSPSSSSPLSWCTLNTTPTSTTSTPWKMTCATPPRGVTTPTTSPSPSHKGHGKLSIRFAADQKTIETFFCIIAFANQLTLYGAVANMCEEFEFHQDRSGQLDVLIGQSIVSVNSKQKFFWDNDITSHQNLLLHQVEERIKLISQENKVSKFCMDSGFMRVVQVEEYVMTKDTKEQFFVCACREYTLPRSDKSSQPKGWIQGNTRIGPVLEVTTSCLHGKHGSDIGIWSLSEDNSQSSVRISHGSNRFVIDSNHNNTEIPEDLPEEQASQLKMKDFAARSKAKSKKKTTKKRTCWFTEHHSDEWKKVDWHWTRRIFSLCVRGLEESRQSSSTLSNGTTRRRRSNSILEDQEFSSESISTFFFGRQIVGKHAWQQEVEQKGEISTALIFQEQLFISELFKVILNAISLIFHSRTMWSFRVDSSNIFIILGVFFNLDSIINNGLILGGQNSSNRDEGHQDPAKIDLNKPRRTQYLYSAWKKHQDAVFWVDINLSIQKGWTFYKTRSNAIILQGTTSSLLYSKSCQIEDWRSLIWEIMYVSSTTTKDLITTRSRLDQRECSIGFYSWTTVSR